MFSGIGINHNSFESFMYVCVHGVYGIHVGTSVESPYRLRTACVLVQVSSLCGLAYFGVLGSNNQEMYASGIIVTLYYE